MARRAAQQRAQPRQDFLHVEGLGDIIVRAGVEPLHLVAPAIARGEDEHRHHAAGAAPLFKNRNPVLLWQADIEHDRVVWLGVAEEVPLLPVIGAVDGVARLIERLDDLPIEIAIIFDNEEPHETVLL